MKKTEWKSPALLFLTAVVWGVAFVAQSVGMDYVGPFTFNCIRCLIGAVVLVPCIWFLDGWKQRPDGAFSLPHSLSPLRLRKTVSLTQTSDYNSRHFDHNG